MDYCKILGGCYVGARECGVVGKTFVIREETSLNTGGDLRAFAAENDGD